MDAQLLTAAYLASAQTAKSTCTGLNGDLVLPVAGHKNHRYEDVMTCFQWLGPRLYLLYVWDDEDFKCDGDFQNAASGGWPVAY